ncbi:ABC transporter ATP-binding protein [Halovivax gelatinilyticus]|uniref:ABC transporter ATP-binding protein n=1 Tax=Halovivax gelatinilyticus TaxID=2961597 RepID=UPI0020CA757E|nr:ABC transporter ATP-binding protein [Halovivax gelatinilyticus]
MTETPPILTTDGLTKRFGSTVAVGDLDLTIDAGTIYGFLGPNGAGKTTTIRLLTGLTNPTSGTGTIAGQPITDRAAIVPHIGYLPETPPLYNELTGREQLEYHGGLRDMDPDAIRERLEHLFDRLGLSEAADDRIGTYSKGMRKKTGLIQALMHEPDVVILDEPISGLDPRAARTVSELLVEYAEGGSTVFYSTHVLSVVDQLASTVGILYNGELVAEGEPKALVGRMESDGDGTLEDVFLAVTTDDEPFDEVSA